MSYPDQVPPEGPKDLSGHALVTLAFLAFGAGAWTFIVASTPLGGFVAGFLVAVALVAMFAAGCGPKR